MEKTAIMITAIVSMAVTGISGYWLIPMLKKLKFGQTINDIGPTWHKGKEGTPTMGGLMMILGAMLALAAGYITLILAVPQFLTEQYFAENIRFFASIGAALGFGLIGFIDDFTKIRHHENLGLTAKQKMVPQVVLAAIYVFVMYKFGECGTEVAIPFFGNIDFGFFYFFISIFLIVGFVNAVNLTDGLDGLCSSVTFVVSVGMVIISAVRYPGIGLFSTAIAGACAGFLLWNFYPAKTFMGDTGSMFLGGSVIAMCFGVSYPTLIFFICIVYFCEALSLMIQVCYFKATHGKRLFKMTPIHHHFELSGYSEVKIVILFSMVTAAGAALAVWFASMI